MKRALLTLLMFCFTVGPEFAAWDGREQPGITIALAGDMLFDRHVAKQIERHGGSFVFDGYAAYLKDSDIVLGNLETPLSDRGTAMEDKEYTFRSRPEIAGLLKQHHITAVSIANNHILDYGMPAFTDTMKHLKEAGVYYSGGGHNREEAEAGVVIERNGIKTGFIAFSGVVPSTDWYAGRNKPGIIGAYKVHEAAVVRCIERLKEKCDLVVVSVHWGKEGSLEIREQEREMAHKMADAGADIVMGHHPHVVQGVELYNGKLIFYSLGNFIFTQSHSELSNRMMAVRVRYGGDKKLAGVEIVPGVIRGSRPEIMNEEEKRQFLSELNQQSINIKF